MMRRDKRWGQLLGAMVRAEELSEKNKFGEAQFILLEVRKLELGQRSAHLAWCLAVVCDRLGDIEMASRYIEEAIAQDPMAVPYHRSFDIIVGRIQLALTDEGRAPDDPAIPRLYRVLVASGEANLACHLVMARHHAATGNTAAALELLDAAVTLEPMSRKAWETMAEVARGAGNLELAAKAEAESALLPDEESPQLAAPEAQA